MNTKQAHTPTPAEIDNARAYIAELDAMRAECDRVTHIKLGFIRCAAVDRLRNLECAKYRAEISQC